VTARFVGPLLAGLAACSSLTETAGGVGGLTVLAPSPAELEAGQTIQLQAVAVNGNQDTVDIPIIWLALDTTIAVDSLTGMVTGRTAGQTGRVIARAADLYSAEVKFSILRRVDTLVRVSADTQSVVPPATFSGSLVVRLSGGDPLTPVAGRRVIFSIVSPEFATAADRTVEFPGGLLRVSSLTGATGEPPGVRVQERTGTTPPDSVIVEASAYRPAGGPAVPGSGARFIIRFRTP
jgi:hypothetical protein